MSKNKIIVQVRSPLPKLAGVLGFLVMGGMSAACDDVAEGEDDAETAAIADGSDEALGFRSSACEYPMEAVSVDQNGAVSPDRNSFFHGISADGTKVVFTSQGTFHPDAAGSNEKLVYVRDRVTGTTELVSRNVDGVLPQTSMEPSDPYISGNGKFVIYLDRATDLVEGDTNDARDTFMRDLDNGQNLIINRLSQADGGGLVPVAWAIPMAISHAGNLVVFGSNGKYDPPPAADDDFQSHQQLYVRDWQAETTRIISLTAKGLPAEDNTIRAVAIVGTADHPLVVINTEDPLMDGQGAGAFIRDLTDMSLHRVTYGLDGLAVAPLGLVTAAASGDTVFYVTADGVLSYDRVANRVDAVPIPDCDTSACRIQVNRHVLADGSIGPADAQFMLVTDNNGRVGLWDLARNLVIDPLVTPDGDPLDTSSLLSLAGDATAISFLTGDDPVGDVDDDNGLNDIYVRKLYPEWGPGRDYEEDDLVSFFNAFPGVPQEFDPSKGTPRLNGDVYRARLGHTGQNDWPPDTTATLWERVERCEAQTPTSEWQPHFNYGVGDVVEFSGVNYECRIGHASQPDWTPPATPALWQAL